MKRGQRPEPPAVAATPQTTSSAYLPAYRDPEFLLRDAMWSLRFQLELMKPDVLLDEARVASTLVIYGSARIPAPEHATAHPLGHHYAAARALARLASAVPPDDDGRLQFVVCSGGGPSIMEAVNRGAAEAGRPSIGLNIVLPREQLPNAFVTPDLSFQFHHFALRKLHFMLRARGFVVFPSGFGTLDELFDVLALMQTGKMPTVPLVLFDKAFWRQLIDFDLLVESGLIGCRDLDLIEVADSAEAAWAAVQRFHASHPEPVWHPR